MTYSTLWLAQTQFFVGLGFMLLFLVLEFGLAWVLLYFRVMAVRGSVPAGWLAAYRFWVRVFALAFILGFAAGVSVLIQFGSVWPYLMSKIGDVAGPLLAVTILSMFLFKSCFLGAMLFGGRRLSDRVHTVVVAMVAIGVTLSSFFLLALISWLHTPSGARLVNGQYVVDDAIQVLFSPALPWYSILFVAIAMLVTAFLMLATVAGQAARNPGGVAYRPVFRTALAGALAGVVLHGAAVVGTTYMAAQHQPAKAAALAGYWHSGSEPEWVVAGWPDAATASNRFAWVWQARKAWWLGADDESGWRGLDQFSGMTPPVALTFWSFRVAGIASLFMAVLAVLVAWRLRRHRYDLAAFSGKWSMLLKVAAASGGVLVWATMGYVHFGAFPYAVYETITLSEVVTPVSFPILLGTSIVYALCYGFLLTGFLYLLRYISRYGVIPVSRRRRRA